MHGKHFNYQQSLFIIARLCVLHYTWSCYALQYSFVTTFTVFFGLLKSEGISQIVSGLSNFNMMPMAIYPKALKFFGTFIIPIFIVSNFPPLFVLGRLNIGTQIWGIVAPILFFGGARIVFKKAIRKYSSIANYM